jgi:hypothetical protein
MKRILAVAALTLALTGGAVGAAPNHAGDPISDTEQYNLCKWFRPGGVGEVRFWIMVSDNRIVCRRVYGFVCTSYDVGWYGGWNIVPGYTHNVAYSYCNRNSHG